jgi:elongation factor Ts
VLAVARSADGRSAALVEVNCETDFVARQPDFQAFAAAVAQAALASGAEDADALGRLALAGGKSVDDVRRELIARIGENITVRRAARLAAPTRIGSYVHGIRIGTLVGLQGGDEPLARDLAMHVAAANPQYVKPEDVPAATVAKEHEILMAQAAAEGKPANIVEKMVEGRLRKYLAEICLIGQPFVKDPDLAVGKLLQQAGATVTGFLRFEVGEGIEKKQADFAAEVMAQVEAAKGRG